MRTAQQEYLFEQFCRDAKYIANMKEPYTISYGGKILRSKETDDLFNQYVKAHEQSEVME